MAYGAQLSRLNPLEPRLIEQTFRLRMAPTAALLDIGCGRGTTLDYLASRHSWQLCGLDADPEYAARPGTRLGLAEELPYADGSFDALLMECVFSLISAPARSAAENRRVLKERGLLLISDLYARQGQTCINDGQLLHHIYSRKQMEQFFTDYGFTLVEFQEHSFELLTMLGQMLFDGPEALCPLGSPAARAELKAVKAGYGLWLWQKVG